MENRHDTSKTETTQRGSNPGLLRPPIVFLAAIVAGIALNLAWPLPLKLSIFWWLGLLLTGCAALLFLLSYREFRAAGTSVRGSERTTAIVRTGPYRFSRNPIYVSFVMLVLGLSVWLNNLWLLITLVPAVGLIGAFVIPREERFLEHNFREQYANYKDSVHRWL